MVFPNAIRIIKNTARGNSIGSVSLYNVAYFHHRPAVYAKDGLFGFFKKDSADAQVTETTEAQVESTVEESTEAPAQKRRKAPLTPEELENTIKDIVKEYTQTDDSKWRQVKFDDKKVKYQILQECMLKCQREIPNASLNNMQNIQDLLHFYLQEETPFKSVHPVAEWFQKNKAQFPPNMHFVKYDKRTKKAHNH
ncbi:hypothetical protein K493DRAFT_333967 [Basidiobolus meristosporus CBS 931.73]|uniref:Large ribosomal subunit protein mL50 n=1 Tax=Basidiobolus meristosporus CBS 931.73 TaxID=1314790 RepID=A0A1Y1Z2C4_9FUNG|nr:hypothetical protein K493DRAFT_333967 [Basidiobolus meristosporus CBS 931.73]|eukprot:ORY04346.1 hypothetical protein K493DRAFT_333967 [Basidiobolus meristosporus CBS 931.73]